VIRVLALITLFCLDVRVKAESEVYAGDSKKTYQSAGATVIMQPGSLLETREGQSINLVKGRFFVELRDSALVRTPFASVACAAGECQALVFRTLDKMEIRALKGEFMVRRLGDEQHYSLIAGAQVAVKAVTEQGVSEMDFPQALPWDSTVKEWAKFFPGSIKEFKPTLVEFREVWKQTVERMSELHTDYANRTLASHERALASEAARRAAQEREDAKLRKLFREKNNM
jgi:hypothetical protein